MAPASPKTPQRKGTISPTPSPRPSPLMTSPGSFLKRAVSAGWKRRKDPLDHPLPPGSVSSTDFDSRHSPARPHRASRTSPLASPQSSPFATPLSSPLADNSSFHHVAESPRLPNSSEPDFEMVTRMKPLPRAPQAEAGHFHDETIRLDPSTPRQGRLSASETPIQQSPRPLSRPDLSPSPAAHLRPSARPSTADQLSSDQLSADQLSPSPATPSSRPPPDQFGPATPSPSLSRHGSTTPGVSRQGSVVQSPAPNVPAMAPKRRESLRRRSSARLGLGIDNTASNPLSPRGDSHKSDTLASYRFGTPEPATAEALEPPLERTNSNSSISEEVMTVSPVSPASAAYNTPMVTPPLSITPRRQPSIERSHSTKSRDTPDSVDPLVVPSRVGVRRHSSLKDFKDTSPLSVSHLRRSASVVSNTTQASASPATTPTGELGYFAYTRPSDLNPGTPTSPGTPLNYSQEMMSKRTPVPTQRYDSLIPPPDASVSRLKSPLPESVPSVDSIDNWSPMKTQSDSSFARPQVRPKPSLSVSSQRASQSIPGPPMSSMWLDDNSDEESKPESRWRGLRRSSKTNSTISTTPSTTAHAQGMTHSASFPLLPLRETAKSDSLRSSSSSNYNEPHRLSDRQSNSDKSTGETEPSSTSSPVPSFGQTFTPKSAAASPSRFKSPLRRSESGSNKWSVNNIFSRSPRHKKTPSNSSDHSATISRPYNFAHVNHMGLGTHVSQEAMAAPVPVPDSPNPGLQSPLHRNKSTSSAHALKNGFRSVKDRAMGHSPSKSLSGESFDNSFGPPITKTPSNATGYSLHTTLSRGMMSEPGVTLNTSKPMRPRRPDDLVLPRAVGSSADDETVGSAIPGGAHARRLSNSSSNYSSNSTVGTAKSQPGVTAATTPSMSPDGRESRFSTVQSEHAARVANLLKDNNISRASPAASPNPSLGVFPPPNLPPRHSWRFSDAELDIEEEEESEFSPPSSPRIPQRSDRRRGSLSYEHGGFLQAPSGSTQGLFQSPRLSHSFESSPQLPGATSPSLQTPPSSAPSSAASQLRGGPRKNLGLGLIKNQPSSDSIGSSWTSPGSDFVDQHNWLCQSSGQSDMESASTASTPNASQTTFRRSALLPSPLLPQQQPQQAAASPSGPSGSNATNGNARHMSTPSLPSHGAILEDLVEENVGALRPVRYEQTQTWL